MVLSFDEVGEILDEIAEKLPEGMFRALNGGVLLLEDEVPDPDNGPGRYINIYYGSFAALFFDEPREVWEEELDTTLRHELTHHVESLAGERSLELKDEAFLETYKEEQNYDD